MRVKQNVKKVYSKKGPGNKREKPESLHDSHRLT
jgi:hypothetical protein